MRRLCGGAGAPHAASAARAAAGRWSGRTRRGARRRSAPPAPRAADRAGPRPARARSARTAPPGRPRTGGVSRSKAPRISPARRRDRDLQHLVVRLRAGTASPFQCNQVFRHTQQRRGRGPVWGGAQERLPAPAPPARPRRRATRRPGSPSSRPKNFFHAAATVGPTSKSARVRAWFTTSQRAEARSAPAPGAPRPRGSGARSSSTTSHGRAPTAPVPRRQRRAHQLGEVVVGAVAPAAAGRRPP